MAFCQVVESGWNLADGRRTMRAAPPGAHARPARARRPCAMPRGHNVATPSGPASHGPRNVSALRMFGGRVAMRGGKGEPVFVWGMPKQAICRGSRISGPVAGAFGPRKWCLGGGRFALQVTGAGAGLPRPPRGRLRHLQRPPPDLPSHPPPPPSSGRTWCGSTCSASSTSVRCRPEMPTGSRAGREESVGRTIAGHRHFSDRRNRFSDGLTTGIMKQRSALFWLAPVPRRPRLGQSYGRRGGHQI